MLFYFIYYLTVFCQVLSEPYCKYKWQHLLSLSPHVLLTLLYYTHCLHVNCLDNYAVDLLAWIVLNFLDVISRCDIAPVWKCWENVASKFNIFLHVHTGWMEWGFVGSPQNLKIFHVDLLERFHSFISSIMHYWLIANGWWRFDFHLSVESPHHLYV